MNTFLRSSILSLALLATSCQEDLSTESKRFVSEDQLEKLLQGPIDQVLIGLNTILKGNHDKLIRFGNETDETTGQASVNIASDLMTEDIAYTSGQFFRTDYLHQNRGATQDKTEKMWMLYYLIIKDINKGLKAINTRSDLQDNKDIKTVKGQMLTWRAYAYFYLIRLYQHTYKGHESAFGVPLHTETTETGKKVDRGTVSAIYDRITSDLEQAHQLLQGYSQKDKTEIDRKVVAGLSARVYLTMEDWTKAAQYAREARAEKPLMDQMEYKKGFSSLDLPEVIWGTSVDAGNNPLNRSFFSHMSSYKKEDGYGSKDQPKMIWQPLYEKIPDTDYRKKMFNDPGKSLNTEAPAYANLKFFSAGSRFTGDLIWMRSSEMYLIEAEAEARKNNTSGAQQILNELAQKRDTAFNANIYSGDDLINQILLQRRIELWGEGFAWFDAKRLKKDIDRTTSNRLLSVTNENNNHPSEAQKIWPAESDDFRFKIPEKEFEGAIGMDRSQQNP